MWIYIVNAVSLTLIGLLTERFAKSKKWIKIYCIYAFVQLTLLAAVRYNIGIDYTQYYHAFLNIGKAVDWNEVWSFRYEPGYLIINRVISLFTNNVPVYMGIYAAIMYGLVMIYIYRYCEEKWVAVLSFIALDYYALTYCFMRQGMAMIIGLYAIEFMRKNKWYFAVPLVLLSACFHASALILLFYFAVSYINWRKRWIQISALIMSVIVYWGCDIILENVLVGPFEKYRDYLESSFMAGNSYIIVFYPVFCVVMFFIVFNGTKEGRRKIDRLVPMLFVGVVLTILSTKHYIIERMALYMTIYNIRIVPMLVHGFYKKNEQWNYQLATISALIVCTSAFVFGISSDRYRIVPYQIATDQLENVPLLKCLDKNVVAE